MDKEGDSKTNGVMRRFFILFGLILATLLILQLFRSEKNLGEIDTSDDFIQVSQVPDTLASVFLNSCYDCHSNYTNYPWYGNLAPASWILNRHINEGKEQMNFSSWGVLNKAQKISQLDQICDECTNGSMPLQSYLLIHRSAVLGADNIEAICDWAEQEAMEIMGSGD